MLIKKFILAAVCALALITLFAATSCGGNGNLKIMVTDSGGIPVWGAKVVSEGQPSGQLKIDGLTTEEAGGVIFNDIRSGTYEIQVSLYGFAPEIIDVSVRAGKTAEISIVLFYASPPAPIT